LVFLFSCSSEVTVFRLVNDDFFGTTNLEVFAGDTLPQSNDLKATGVLDLAP